MRRLVSQEYVIDEDDEVGGVVTWCVVRRREAGGMGR